MVEDLVKGGKMPTDLGGGPHINVSALEPYLEQLKPFYRHIIVLGHDLIVNGSFQVADIHKIELNGSERHVAAIEYKCTTGGNLPRLMIAGWISHPLGNATLSRRTRSPAS